MKPLRYRALSIYAAAVLVFLYLPIAVLVVYSFNRSRINAVWTGWTWNWYVSLFQNDRVVEAFGNSITIAFCTMIISTVLGTMAAVGMQRFTRWKLFWNGLVYLPILIPDILLGLSLLVMFSQTGIPLGKTSMILAHVTFSIPFVFAIVSARLAGIGKEFEEAASDLGARPWQTFRHVTLPMLAPAVISSMLLTFTMSLDDFVISFFVSGPNSTTLPLYIYGLVKRGVTPEVNALSALMIVTTVVLIVLAELYRRKGSNNKNELLL